MNYGLNELFDEFMFWEDNNYRKKVREKYYQEADKLMNLIYLLHN